MKRRPMPCGQGNAIRRFLNYPWLAVLFIALTLLAKGCKPKDNELARLTTVYGKVTDQAGLPVDSMSIVMLGYEGVLGGLLIDKAYTDQKGEYKLVVDVPLPYSFAGVQVNFEYRSLLDKYYNQLIYKNGVQQGDCCIVTMGAKTNYDFVLLPK